MNCYYIVYKKKMYYRYRDVVVDKILAHCHKKIQILQMI